MGGNSYIASSPRSFLSVRLPHYIDLTQTRANQLVDAPAGDEGESDAKFRRFNRLNVIRPFRARTAWKPTRSAACSQRYSGDFTTDDCSANQSPPAAQPHHRTPPNPPKSVMCIYKDAHL